MEHFDNTDSWAAMGRHILAPPVKTLDEQAKASFNLSPDDIYVVTMDGRTRDCTWEGWHGQHCLFYSPKDDWRLIVHHSDLRKLVKRRKS